MVQDASVQMATFHQGLPLAAPGQHAVGGSKLGVSQQHELEPTELSTAQQQQQMPQQVMEALDQTQGESEETMYRRFKEFMASQRK